MDMDKGLRIIVEPAVKDLEPIHQSLGVGAVIRLPVLEFHGIYRRQDRSFIQSVPDKFLQCPSDNIQKLLLLLHADIFCDDGEIHLPYASLIGAFNLTADTGVQKGLLERRPLRFHQHMVQYPEGAVQFPVQALPGQHIIAEICFPLRFLPLRGGIETIFLLHSVEWLLQADLGIYLQIIKMT